MELNIKTFLYIFLHLCPLILICFFTISSIFNNDLKGIVFLAGLLVSIGVIIFGGNLMSFLPEWLQFPTNPKDESICNVLSFGNGQLSNLSIGQMIIGFAFSYLLTTILTREDDIISSTWPTITFFSLLMFAELLVNTNITGLKQSITNWWNGAIDNTDTQSQYCYHWITSLITYGIAGGLGIGYAFLVNELNNPYLQYFGKYKNNEKCEKVSKKTFACKVFKNGTESNTPITVHAPPTE